jgi:hypothetical protein
VQRIKLELLCLWLGLLFVVQIILLFFEQIIENKLSSTYIWSSVMNRMVSSRIILVYCLQRTYHYIVVCLILLVLLFNVHIYLAYLVILPCKFWSYIFFYEK